MVDAPIYPQKAWTILVFMAGDNDLESFAHLDLAEMDALPSDEHLNVAVQFDSRSKVTYRFRFFPGGHEMAGEPLGETNTGAPTTLTQFVTWGKQHFPAQHTALVIWNHGTGLRELPPNFDYSTLRSEEASDVRKELKRTLFSSTLAKIAQTRRRLRGIAVDATDRDYLDNQELQKAIIDVPGNGPRVDLLGFDACLMSAVEIAYQMRGLAYFMVGSQEIEPGSGWPYHSVLTALAAKPDMSVRQLAETMVTCYAGAMGHSRLRGQEASRTQSALNLDQVDQTFELIRDLAFKVNDPKVINNSVVRQALCQAHEEAIRFKDRDLADLLDWCNLLYRETKGRAGDVFRDQLQALRAHLESREGLVTTSQASGGDDPDRIHGVSIYWPRTDYSPTYDKLDFAASGWGQLAKTTLTL
jgi:hypothetical protein